MPRLAIIAAYLGKPNLLEETLLSVLSSRPDDCEVLVVLGRAYDDPYELEGEVRFVRLPGRAGWVETLNAGIEATRAPVIHLLACGAEVVEGWADEALAHFNDPRVAAVAPLVLDQGHPERVIAAGMSYHVGGAIRALACGQPAGGIPLRVRGVLAPHPVAAFYRRSVLERVGRLDRRAGERLAGLDLGLVLNQLGLRTVLEPRCRVAVRPEAMFRRGSFREAMESERFFWRWACTIGLLRSLVVHGVLLTGESVRSLGNLSIVSRWAGRLAGACLALGSGGVSRRGKQLRESLRGQPLDSLVKAPHFSMTAGRKKVRATKSEIRNPK